MRTTKALLLSVAAVFVLMAGAVHGGCCLNNNVAGGGAACAPKTTKAICDSLSGTYFAGTGSADWVCQNNGAAGFACVCPPGSVCGDPHITGFDGSSYILWGQQDKTYNILSERNHQVNTRLFDDATPASDSSHENHALFIDAVGLMINDARIAVRMVSADTAGVEPELAGILSLTAPSSQKSKLRLAVSTSAPDGTKRRHVVWTGKPVREIVDDHTSYSFIDETRVAISSSQISLTVVLRDNHHLDFQVNAIAVSWSAVHGVLGQSYAAAFGNHGAAAPSGGTASGVAKTSTIIKKQLRLEGKEEDYITSGLLSADDKFSQFVVGGSKLHAMVVEDATAVSRKLLMKTSAAAGSLVVGDSVGMQDAVEMIWSAAGMIGDP